MTNKEIIAGLAHGGHHDIHWEFCWDFDERVAYIKAHKPVEEQALRLKLFGIVPLDKIPGKDSAEWQAARLARQVYDQTWQAYKQAGQVWEQARQAYDVAWQAWQARQAYDVAWQAYLEKFHDELELLHKELYPDCPWDGETIFTRKDENGEWY